MRCTRILGIIFFLLLTSSMGSAFSREKGSLSRQQILDEANALRSRAEFGAVVAQEETEALLVRAIVLVEENLGIDARELAFFRAALGRFYRFCGRLEEAQAQNREALRIDPEVGPPVLLEIGEVALQLGRFAEASEAFAESSEIETTDSSYRQRTHAGLAEVAFHRKLWRASAESWSREIDELIVATLGSRILSRQNPGGRESGSIVSTRSRAPFYGFLRASYRAAQQDLALDPEMRARAFEYAQWVTMSRAGEAIQQAVARYFSEGAVSSSEVRERQDLSNLWKALTEKEFELRTSGRELSAEFAELKANKKSILSRLASIDVELSNRLPAYIRAALPTAKTLTEVQAVLRAQEVVVLVVTVPALGAISGETFVWAVGKNEVEWQAVDLDEEAVTNAVATLRCGVDPQRWSGAGGARCERLVGKRAAPAVPLPFDRALAFELYRKLLSGSRLITNSDNIIFVASGALASLPLNILITRKSSDVESIRDVQWLVRSKTISMLPTVSSLVDVRSSGARTQSQRSLIGFADPVLSGHSNMQVRMPHFEAERGGKESSCRVFQRRSVETSMTPKQQPPEKRHPGSVPLVDVEQIWKLRAMPETAKELCAVANSFYPISDGVDIYLAEQATEAKVKELSQSGELAKYRIVYFATHGLTASRLNGVSEPGLVFTLPDSASVEDDGYLSSSEIVSLKLDAELVVLSACNTASGSAQEDESLSGLAQAFFFSGGRALLVSHWAVNSEFAARLTVAAFRMRKQSNSMAESLRSALRELLDRSDENSNHPQVWAPFAFIGDPSL